MNPGLVTIDGLRLEFLRLQHAETENALMIALPDDGILIAQDFLYHGAMFFLASVPSTPGSTCCESSKCFHTIYY